MIHNNFKAYYKFSYDATSSEENSSVKKPLIASGQVLLKLTSVFGKNKAVVKYCSDCPTYVYGEKHSKNSLDGIATNDVSAISEAVISHLKNCHSSKYESKTSDEVIEKIVEVRDLKMVPRLTDDNKYKNVSLSSHEEGKTIFQQA